MFVAAGPALAHGGEESEEGYALVQQAIGYLTNFSGEAAIEPAAEKVGDALATSDQDGIDVAQLEQAQAALEAGDAEQARSLLQESITEAVAGLPPATGEETGTTVISDELAGNDGLDGTDVGLLLGSIALLGLGVGLSWRFRPDDTVKVLRRRIGGTPPPQPKAKNGSVPSAAANSSKEA
ncbi:MAG TPA: hypothetical protein VFE20_06120 [Thermoleophilia bacterium]|nr:hypothetical protein [Thermoleophilia bacterium]